MDFWTVFNWLWGGTDAHEIVWPEPFLFSLIVAIGFIEFVLYRLAIHWMNKNYGSPHGFWHFVAFPVIHNVQADSTEGLRLLEVQDRYKRYVEQTRQQT